ncbi:MAG: 2-oxoacid:ferredoxin oxidoreductase subunit beta, partial [Acidobacteriota bacterium]|nr:2-oxoacid:ferredoxin oxidoreductase subunit beta [Acidobacteriota bacterium]
FIPFFEDISVDYDPGTTTSITMHDGSHMMLRKLATEYDATNKGAALHMLTESHDKGEIVTGLFYVDPQRPNFIDQLNVMDDALATLPESKVRPPKEVLDQVMQSLM